MGTATRIVLFKEFLKLSNNEKYKKIINKTIINKNNSGRIYTGNKIKLMHEYKKLKSKVRKIKRNPSKTDPLKIKYNITFL